MQRTQRFHAVIVASTMILMLPATSLAHAPAAPPSPPAPPASSSARGGAVVSQSGEGSVIVRTVSAPGGMSSEMKASMMSIDALFSPSARGIQSLQRTDGTRVLTSPSRFLSFYVGRLDADGVLSARCVSSQSEALREMAPDPAKAVGAEKE